MRNCRTIVDAAGDGGSASQQSMTVCVQRQPRQPSDDLHETVSPHHHHHHHHHAVCYQSATPCPGDCSSSRRHRDDPTSADAGRPGRVARVHLRQLILARYILGRPGRVVIDALRTTPDDHARSQITCRILQTSTAPGRPAGTTTTATRKAITPLCNGRQRAGAANTRTGLTDSYGRPQQRPAVSAAAYYPGKQNGNV